MPTSAVGKRIFATLGYPDGDWGMVKLTPEQQSMLVEAEPDIFRPVPAGGASKATQCPACERRSGDVEDALNLAWRNIAPKPRQFAQEDDRLILRRINFPISCGAYFLSMHPSDTRA